MELPTSTATDRRTFETRPLPVEFHEPDTNRTDYLPYEPTPAGLFAPCEKIKAELRDHQDEVDRQFDILFAHAPADIPEGLKEAILTDYLAGEAQRRIKNLESYRTWGDEDKVKYQEEETALLLGTITPNQTILLLQQSELQSAELAKVTHPYRYRMEYVELARSDVRSAIESRGGAMYPSVGSYRKIGFQPDVETDVNLSEMMLNGFRVTYKREVGHVTREDDRRVFIIERQSAAIRIDEAATDLDPTIAQELRKVSHVGNRDAWLEAVNKKTNYETYFENAIQEDTTANYFIPLSTMWYARVESQEEYNERMKQEEAVANMARVALGNTDSPVYLFQ